MENINQILSGLLAQPAFMIFLMPWTLFWKGLSLWRAAGKRHLLWFVLLLIINTLGILEIAYVFWLNRWDIDGGKLLNFLEKKFKCSKKSA